MTPAHSAIRIPLALLTLSALATLGGGHPGGSSAAADLLDDTYEDTHRLEPDDIEELPEGEGVEPSDELREQETEPAEQDPDMQLEPEPEPAEELPAAEPDGIDELDDTYEDTERIVPEDMAPEELEQTDPEGAAGAPPEPATEDDYAPTEPAPGRAAEETAEADHDSWMHRYDHVGLYGTERPDGSSRFEGIHFHGYKGPTGGRDGTTGIASLLSADLPLAADEDGLGEAYIGFGVQTGTGRLTLYGTVGGVYARTVRASDDTRSDTDWGADAGIKVGITERTMATVALREDPNELIDDQTARLGFHIDDFYIGVRQRIDADLGRLDLAVRF